LSSPFTDPISLTQIRNNLDDQRVQMLANARAGARDVDVALRRASLANGAALSSRSRVWTQLDDAILQGIALTVTDGTAGRVVVASLTLADDGDDYLLGRTVSVSVTSIVGTAQNREDLRVFESPGIALLAGVRYRLAIVNNAAATTISGPIAAAVQWRADRRRS
jgi:hypothetical protein